MFLVRLWFFLECGRLFIESLLVSLVAKDIAAQSILIFLVQAGFFGLAMFIRPYDNKRDNLVLVLGSLANTFIALFMMILSIDEHKYEILSATTRVRYVDRYCLFGLFILRQFVTIGNFPFKIFPSKFLGVFFIRALGNWQKVQFLFKKPEEEAWKKKKREAEEREITALRKREEEELKNLELELEQQEAGRQNKKNGGGKKGPKEVAKIGGPGGLSRGGVKGDPDKTHKVNGGGKEMAKPGKGDGDGLDQTFAEEFEPGEKGKKGKGKKGKGKVDMELMNEDVDPALKIEEVGMNETLKLSNTGTADGNNAKHKKNKQQKGKKTIFGENDDLNALIAKGKKEKARRRNKRVPQNLDKIDYKDDALDSLKIQL